MSTAPNRPHEKHDKQSKQKQSGRIGLSALNDENMNVGGSETVTTCLKGYDP